MDTMSTNWPEDFNHYHILSPGVNDRTADLRLEPTTSLNFVYHGLCLKRNQRQKLYKREGKRDSERDAPYSFLDFCSSK